ncbi:MAG TPA: hypothetical protein VN666_04035 [Nitrospira sp.]|nr:hypothetical protein [Nitrospira sp.]
MSGVLGILAGATMSYAQTTVPDQPLLIDPDTGRTVQHDTVQRERAVDERVQPVVVEERVVERRYEGELYVAGFGGFTLGQGFSNVNGIGTLATQNIGNFDTANSVIYGMKVGYFLPARLNWLGFEMEGFNTTPHLKQQDGLIGSNLRVTTLAFNVIARKRLGCRDDNREHYDRTRQATYDQYGRHYEKNGQHYDGWSPEDENERCPLQVYAGVGPAIFFTQTSNVNGQSSDLGEVGVNFLTGAKYFVHRNVAIFGEYKFNHAGFDFARAYGTTAGIQGNYSASHFVGGLAVHF